MTAATGVSGVAERPGVGDLVDDLRRFGSEHWDLAQKNYAHIAQRFGDPLATVRAVPEKVRTTERRANEEFTKASREAGRRIEAWSAKAEAFLAKRLGLESSAPEPPRPVAAELADDEF
ncbi:MAG: hypothetical protein ACT4PT_04625 [Methanobacteriota archaeon]